MRIVAVTEHPTGRRLWIFGCRIHHGLAGVFAIFGGIVAVWCDRHDFPWGFRDGGV